MNNVQILHTGVKQMLLIFLLALLMHENNYRANQ